MFGRTGINVTKPWRAIRFKKARPYEATFLYEAHSDADAEAIYDLMQDAMCGDHEPGEDCALLMSSFKRLKD